MSRPNTPALTRPVIEVADFKNVEGMVDDIALV